MNPRALRRAWLTLPVGLLFAACGGGEVTPPNPPGAPANVRMVSAGDAAVTISWDPVSGATSYNVYGASQAGVTKANYSSKPDGLKRANATSPAAITGLINGKTYYFIVTAANADGESSESGEVNATPQAAFSPGANTQLAAGNYTYSSLSIPANVTVTLTGAVLITVTGDATIAGTLTGDCTSIEIRVGRNFTLDGLVRNTCTALPGSPPGIKIVADSNWTIGSTVSNQDAIVSDGSIRITDAATENVSFTPLAEFPTLSASSTPRSNVVAPNSGQANLGKANRPIRAGRGQDNRMSKDGPVDVGGEVSGGNGNDAPAKTQAGTCDNSTALGGNGGAVYIVARGSTVTFKTGSTVKAGNGGKGGSCTAPSGCPAAAIAGKGGDGGGIYVGGQNIVFEASVTLTRGSGGAGGDATAIGDAGPAACANGCHAVATAGQGGTSGGIGYVVTVPGTITGSPSEAGADGGTGGAASATGGAGRDCAVCPAGKGGDGGNATATGGQGGNGATGSIWPVAAGSHRKGNGGNANAVGGNGGKGADCCQKFNDQAGGNGGKGGVATATSGQIGTSGIGGNGTRGVASGSGGNGNDGGDGAPPGALGSKGEGIGDVPDIPDGADGIPGAPCPPVLIWFIYFSSIPDGPITPGSDLGLAVYESTVPANPKGTVMTHFMNSTEFGGEVQYQKSGNDMLIPQGGIRVGLQTLLPGFPVGKVQTRFLNFCLVAQCVQLIGYYQGVERARAGSATATSGQEQTLELPPPSGFPYYDEFVLIGGPFHFNHWWILIIDP